MRPKNPCSSQPIAIPNIEHPKALAVDDGIINIRLLIGGNLILLTLCFDTAKDGTRVDRKLILNRQLQPRAILRPNGVLQKYAAWAVQ